MDNFHAFTYFWLGGVALFGFVFLCWAIRDLQSGIAEVNAFGPYFRAEEPLGFWAIVSAKLAAALVMAPFMFIEGLGMLHG